jgi:16S rRNA processing protein RimM
VLSSAKSDRPSASPRSTLVARIGAAHGIRGEVRVKALTQNPSDVAGYSPLASADGRVFQIETARSAAGTSADMLVVRFTGIDTRNAAEALNGTELFVPRERLGKTEADEYFHADLIGLDAVTTAGKPLGTVVRVENYGAGDLLEIAPRRGDTLLVPFTRAIVPEVDLAGGRVVIEPPPGLLDGGEGTEETRSAGGATGTEEEARSAHGRDRD